MTHPLYLDGTPVWFGPRATSRRARALSGLGQDISGQSIAISSTQIAGGVATAAAIHGAATGALFLGMTPALAVPIIGAAVVGVTIAISLLWSMHHDPRKNATTDIVNQVAPQLQTNLDAYMNGPRTVSSQAQALANFDAGWNLVLQNCGQAQFGQNPGDPGYNCVHDREAGGKWPWPTYYRDPIVNDPNVKPDPASVTTLATQATGYLNVLEGNNPAASISPALVLAGAALLVGVVIL
jgi:hypothetical protein